MSPKSIHIRPFEAKVLFVNQQFGNVHSKHHNPICVRQNEQSESAEPYNVLSYILTAVVVICN